jgi:uncharacterized membrane protein
MSVIERKVHRQKSQEVGGKRQKETRAMSRERNNLLANFICIWLMVGITLFEDKLRNILIVRIEIIISFLANPSVVFFVIFVIYVYI